jgi:peptidoglycan hydrolase-like protein with peptidoglycan-binding domain
MYLEATSQPKYNSTVYEIQQKLNAIRIKVHGNWSAITPDGLFGQKTKQAVIAFQMYRGITPASGIIGDTTIRYINEVYNTNSQLKRTSQVQKVGGTITEFVSELANVLKDISELVEKQIKIFKSQKVTSKDIDRILRYAFNRPDVNKMRDKFEKMMLTELNKIAKSNNNLALSKKNAVKLREISAAKSQIGKGMLNAQSRSAVEKKLAEQLMDKVIKELESANFKEKITNALKYKGKVTTSGNIVLTVVMLIPLIGDLWELLIASCNGTLTEDLVKKVISNIVSLIEGVLIGIAVAAAVVAIGLVGWVAVLVVLIVSIIVGIILEVIFPDHSNWIAEKIIQACTKISTEFNTLINSSVFQEAARTSFR